MVAAISGGTVFPAATGALVTARSAHFAMVIPAIGYVLAFVFPVYVNFFNAETMDLHRASDHGIVAGPNEKETELERAQTEEEKHGARTIEEAN